MYLLAVSNGLETILLFLLYIHIPIKQNPNTQETTDRKHSPFLYDCLLATNSQRHQIASEPQFKGAEGSLTTRYKTSLYF